MKPSHLVELNQAPGMRMSESPDQFLPSLGEVHRAFGLEPGERASLDTGRTRINRIVSGEDQRLLIVVGPCSVHDPKAVLEYAGKLAPLAKQYQDRLEVVLRCYVEKPRTTIGWKGLVYDPHLDGSHDLYHGLMASRQLMRDCARLGLPLATEALSPMIADYLQDLVSWTAIGARTTESQTHREMASGLSSAVGFKNGTDGGLEVAIQAMQSAAHGHVFPSMSHCGRPAIRATAGNPNLHLVLRGGRSGPNHDVASVGRAVDSLRKAGLRDRVMIDCSHDNSGKDYRRQGEVVRSLLPRLREKEHGILGLMLESFLEPGKQPIGAELAYGVSVTDGCIGWTETQNLLAMLYTASAPSQVDQGVLATR